MCSRFIRFYPYLPVLNKEYVIQTIEWTKLYNKNIFTIDSKTEEALYK